MSFGFLRRLRGPLLGAAAASLLFVSASALAGSGVNGVFNLGVSNSVNALTTLSGTVDGDAQLRVENASTAGNSFGVLGRMTSSSAAGGSAGLRGVNQATTSNGFGVFGIHNGTGAGVSGQSGQGTGVLGRHTAATGAKAGVEGDTSSQALNAAGVLGVETSGAQGVSGVRGVGGGEADGVTGVVAAGFSSGVRGLGGPNGTGVFGEADGTGVTGQGLTGVFGTSSDATGVGVLGAVGGGDAIGVEGEGDGGGGIGILGISGSGLAGKFEGDVHVTGSITKDYQSGGPATLAVPIAFGSVNPNGTLAAGTPNVTTSLSGTLYSITIAGESYTNNFVTVVTPHGTAAFGKTGANSGKLTVAMFNSSGGSINTSGFSFITYKP